MQLSVAGCTEGDEVGLGVISESASWVDVMDLEVGRAAAALAAPPIALQHLLAELAVGLGVEAEPGPGAARE